MSSRLSVTGFALLFLLVFPLHAFAVQDVVLQESINVFIDDPGITLIVQPATVDQIVVNTTNVVITMSANGNAVTITSAGKYNFLVSGITNEKFTCESTQSKLVLPGQTSSQAVTVDPTTVCTESGGTSVPSSTSSGGGSTGPAPTTEPVPTEPIPTEEPAPTKGSAPAEETYTTSGETTATPIDGGSTTAITSEGGTAGIDVPPGAVSTDTSFTTALVATTDPAVAQIVSAIPTGRHIVGDYVYQFTATAQAQQVTTFSAEVTLTFTYTAAQVAGLDVEKIEVQYYDEITKLWITLPTTVDLATKTVKANTSHFTRFAIVAPADVNPPAAPSGVSASAQGAGKIRIGWTNPTSDFSHIKIYRSEISGALGDLRVSEIAATEFTDLKNLVDGKRYYYTLRAVDPAGNESINSAQVSAVASGSSAVLREGDLIRGPDGIKVYIINEHGYKRHIFNPAVFGMYGHFSWASIKGVSQEVLDSYKTSDIYRAFGGYRVYSLEEINEHQGLAVKHHIGMSAAQFVAKGYNWNQVFIVNNVERDYYALGTDLKF